MLIFLTESIIFLFIVTIKKSLMKKRFAADRITTRQPASRWRREKKCVHQ